MKHTIFGGFAISALLIAAPLSTASAADLAVPAPVAPVAVYDWSGLYFDVDAGWEKDSYGWNWNSPALVAAGFGAVNMSSPSGVGVGAHIGYQQQFSWLVVGLEAGASKLANSPFSVSNTTTVAFTPPGCGNVVGSFCRAQIGYVSTFGGKLGVDWGNWLVYGVAGKAFGANINSSDFTPPTANEVYSGSNNTGWYAGGGLDYMLLKTRFGDLIGGVEYQHITLQTVQTIATSGTGNTHDLSAKEDMVWAKLTLKLNPFN